MNTIERSRAIDGWHRLRTRFGSSPVSFLVSVMLGILILISIPGILDWAVIKANFSATSIQECRRSGGACWAFVVDKYRFILFGTYPYAEQWRPTVASVILMATVILSGRKQFW